MQVDKTLDFYVYSANFLALANGATASVSFSIDTDSDFYLMKLAQETDIAGAAITISSEPVPLCTVQIVDGGSSRQLASAAVPLHTIFGTGENPFILPSPRMFSAGSTVTVTLTNYSAATTYNVRLAFMGLKQYQFGIRGK